MFALSWLPHPPISLWCKCHSAACLPLVSSCTDSQALLPASQPSFLFSYTARRSILLANLLLHMVSAWIILHTGAPNFLQLPSALASAPNQHVMSFLCVSPVPKNSQRSPISPSSSPHYYLICILCVISLWVFRLLLYLPEINVSLWFSPHSDSTMIP